MRKIYTIVLCAVLIVSPTVALFAQKTKQTTPAKNKPTSARFIVSAVYEETYTNNSTDGKNYSKAVSALKVEIQASRWLVIKKNEVGGDEFWDAAGGEPSAATIKLSYDASEEAKTFNDTGVTSSYEAKSKFSGTKMSDKIAVSNPEWSNTGDGLEFDLTVGGDFGGDCDETYSQARWEWTADGSKQVRAADDVRRTKECLAAEGKPGEVKENTSSDKTTAPLVLSYDIRTKFTPVPHNIQTLKLRGELNENSGVDAARKARIELAQQNQEVQASAPSQIIFPTTFGSKTASGGQSSYKIVFSQEKTDNQDTDSNKQAVRKTKLTMEASIIPGGAAASIWFTNSANVDNLSAVFSTLKEIGEKQ